MLQEKSSEITLTFSVERVRGSVTQGEATVYINGEKAVTFGDEIELIGRGERYYGPIIGGWASKKPDSAFINGLLWHPYDCLYFYSDKAKTIIQNLCNESSPATYRT